MTRRTGFGAAATLALAAIVGASAVSAQTGSAVLAQAGGYGGTIGKQDKSVSGTEDVAPAPAARSPRQPAAAPRERRSYPSFDGTWTVQSTGQNCPINTSAAVIISGGRVIGQNGTGTVSPSGAVSTVGQIGSLAITGRGQLSGRSGSGVFRQSDGCAGRWIASKQ